MNKIIIAIDGHASCGKSTIAKALAKKLDYIFIDSGAMYRAVALYALRNKINPEDEKTISVLMPKIKIEFNYHQADGVNHTYLNGEDVEEAIRTMQVSEAVSPIATIVAVRSALVAQQRAIGNSGGVVMDGRDIGSIVFPNAELKIFVTASIDVRTERRYNELITKGMRVNIEDVKQNLLNRDYIDSNRKISPLMQVTDALVLDTSNLNPVEQLELAYIWATDRISSK